MKPAVETEIALFCDPTYSDAEKITVPISASWQRVTLTYTMTATIAASADTGSPRRLGVSIRPTSAGTVDVGAVMVTRGQALYPYSAVGAGRWPNWIANSSFLALNGWYRDWAPIKQASDFEVDTAGWDVSDDARHTGHALSITRVAAAPNHGGSAHAEIAIIVSGQFARYAIGAVQAGVAYTATVWFTMRRPPGRCPSSSRAPRPPIPNTGTAVTATDELPAGYRDVDPIGRQDGRLPLRPCQQCRQLHRRSSMTWRFPGSTPRPP